MFGNNFYSKMQQSLYIGTFLKKTGQLSDIAQQIKCFFSHPRPLFCTHYSRVCNFSLINSDFSLRPIASVFIMRILGFCESKDTLPPLSVIIRNTLSTAIMETFPNSTYTLPRRSRSERMYNFLHITRSSAIDSRLCTSSGIGPKRSVNSPYTLSKSVSVSMEAIIL